MTEREKVISGLECCTQHGSMCGLDCSGYWGWIDSSHTGLELLGEYRTKCPYGNCETGCVKTLAKDALAMLKAQEPRVMTLEEAKSTFVVEYRSGKMREIGSALLDIDVDPLNAEYGKVYRVWTSRPTDEQREAIPWNAQK